MFVTNQTNKRDYRNRLKSWIKALTDLATVENKYKAHLNTARYFINLASGTSIRELIKKGQETGIIPVKSNKSDGARKKLVNQILNIVAHESAAAFIMSEVEILLR